MDQEKIKTESEQLGERVAYVFVWGVFYALFLSLALTTPLTIIWDSIAVRAWSAPSLSWGDMFWLTVALGLLMSMCASLMTIAYD